MKFRSELFNSRLAMRAPSLKLGIVGESDYLKQFADDISKFSDDLSVFSKRVKLADFMSDLESFKFDCLIIDQGDCTMEDTKLVTEIKKCHHEISLVYVVNSFSRDHLWTSILLGFNGYLLFQEIQSYSLQYQLKALKERNTFLVTPYVSSQLVLLAFKPPGENEYSKRLTTREREILSLLAGNRQYKEIADELSITINTIRSHIRRIYQKLEVSSKTEALKKLSFNAA